MDITVWHEIKYERFIKRFLLKIKSKTNEISYLSEIKRLVEKL